MPEAPPFKIPESVLVVIHTPALQVLLIERADHPGYWQSVTGSLDSADEAWAEAARREVLEETGFDAHAPGAVLRDWQLANLYEIYPHWRHRYAPGVTQNTEHVFGLCLPRAATPPTIAPTNNMLAKVLWPRALAMGNSSLLTRFGRAAENAG